MAQFGETVRWKVGTKSYPFCGIKAAYCTVTCPIYRNLNPFGGVIQKRAHLDGLGSSSYNPWVEPPCRGGYCSSGCPVDLKNKPGDSSIQARRWRILTRIFSRVPATDLSLWRLRRECYAYHFIIVRSVLLLSQFFQVRIKYARSHSWWSVRYQRQLFWTRNNETKSYHDSLSTDTG